mgnify:CR=1 FL=1
MKTKIEKLQKLPVPKHIGIMEENYLSLEFIILQTFNPQKFFVENLERNFAAEKSNNAFNEIALLNEEMPAMGEVPKLLTVDQI